MNGSRRRVPALGTASLVALLIALVVGLAGLGARPAAAQDETATVPAGVGAAATEAPEEQSLTDATVRIVHASPDAPPVNVLVDGQPAVQNVAPGSATEYAPLPAGQHQVQLVPATGGAPLVEGTVNAESGAAYIVGAVGPAAQLQLQTYEVNLDAVDPGQARLRVIHAVPDAPAVDVAVAGGDPIVEGVEFPNASDYQTVDAGTYDLEVRNGETDEVLATSTGVALQGGQVYDVVALSQGGTFSLLPLATPVSPPCSQPLGVGGPSDACVRVVHASPDAGNVDVYLDETVIAPGIAYGQATTFAAAPSGEHQIRVVPAGQAPDQAVIDQTQELEAGQAYQVAAAGQAEDIQAIINEIDLTPLPEGQARIRAVHASPDTDAVDVALAGGLTLFEGIEYGNASDYAVVDAATATLQLREADGDTLLLELPNVSLQPGTVYDVFAIGRTEDGTAQLVVFNAPATLRTGQMATPVAATPEAGATPAGVATPVIAAGASPVVEAPGAATPAATPTS